MFKYLLFLAIPLLLFSCNELSDEEMNIRLVELELMKLANEHLEEDIEGLRQEIDAKMALPENKTKIRPLINKSIRLDTVYNDFKHLLKLESHYSKIDLLEFYKYSENYYDSLLQIVSHDSLTTIEIEGFVFENVEFAYPYNLFKSEIDTLQAQQLRLIIDLQQLNSELELNEFTTYTTTYILLLKKKVLRFLLQKYEFPSGKMSLNKLPILKLDNPIIKPYGIINFSVIPSRIYSSNISITNAIYNKDSLLLNSYAYGKSYIDTIWLPTDSLGKHKIDIRQQRYKDTYFESEFNYQVIENE